MDMLWDWSFVVLRCSFNKVEFSEESVFRILIKLGAGIRFISMIFQDKYPPFEMIKQSKF